MLFLLHLRQVVRLGFPLSFFIQCCYHLVVVSLLRLLDILLDKVLKDDPIELLIALVKHLGRNGAHVWLVQEEPVSVLPLEDGEVRVEEGAERLELRLIRHLLLAVVRCVDQVAQDALFDLVGAVVFRLHDDFFDFLIGAEAGPEDQLKFSEH